MTGRIGQQRALLAAKSEAKTRLVVTVRAPALAEL